MQESKSTEPLAGNNINRMDNFNKIKIGWALFVAFLLLFSVTIYFNVYSASSLSTMPAYLLYVATFLSLIIVVIYRKNNVREGIKEGYSVANMEKIVGNLIYLIVGIEIIDIISKHIGGNIGFVVGLLLAMVLFSVIFLFFPKNKS